MKTEMSNHIATMIVENVKKNGCLNMDGGFSNKNARSVKSPYSPVLNGQNTIRKHLNHLTMELEAFG